MSFYLKKLLVILGVKVVRGVEKAPVLLSAMVKIGTAPLLLIWSFLLRPGAIILYKLYIIFGERLKTFFHAQHKLLAVITHRFAIHLFVVLLTTSVVLTNVFQAREVRAEEFAEGSLIAKIFNPDEETIVTAESVVLPQTSYIDTSTSIKITPSIGEDVPLGDSAVAVAGGGGALVKSNVLDEEGGQRGAIQTYVVQGGDTVSSIAEQFNVSTSTILWSNNLSESSLIQPGDLLYILPTSGVAHTVRSGETITSIAQKYQANPDDIIAFNHLINARDLSAGVEIIIPGGKQPAPPSVSTRLASFRDVFIGDSAPASASVSGTKLQWPTTASRISQYFRYGHSGIDIDGNYGDSIYAAESGTVSSVSWYGGYGLQVVINHGNGLHTRYAHLQKAFVSPGDSVSRGQAIAEMGSTGRSSGSHLHFETISGGSFQNPFNYY